MSEAVKPPPVLNPLLVPRAAEAMRSDWDARARENARYFICTDVPADEAEFYASGRADYEQHVRSFLARRSFDAKGKAALEIGCGIGRMTRCFAEDFRETTGVDVSAEMIGRARAAAPPGSRFLLGAGVDLAGVREASVDFVFSFIVFQHIPEKQVILNYFREAGRVLRPGGLFWIHLNGLPHLRVGPLLLEGYISLSPKLRRWGIRRLPLVRRRRLGTWLGHPVSAGQIGRACREGGLVLDEVRGRYTQHMWAGGRKETP